MTFLQTKEAPMNSPETRHTRILTIKDVRARVPYSSVQLWRKERAGEFPGRVRLGANRVGWVEAEVEAWLNSKLAERKQ